MKPNSLNTSDFILERAAPVFNKKGFAGTSLSDLTEATGLTKGAIYFNFKNKEDLAAQAFLFNVRKAISKLSDSIKQFEHAVSKLKAVTNYYRTYFDMTAESGGCPILNMSADANNFNPVLFGAAKKIAKRLENDLTRMIERGITRNEINPEINPQVYGQNLYSMIEGSIFMAFTHGDKSYINNMMDHIDQLIEEKLQI